MIKKGLKVLVLAGKDKKKEGEVIELDRKNNRAKVKDINMVKKHVKTTKEKKGGIFSKESFINLSNLKLINDKWCRKDKTFHHCTVLDFTPKCDSQMKIARKILCIKIGIFSISRVHSMIKSYVSIIIKTLD